MNLGPLSIPIAPFFGSGFVGLAVARLCAEDCEQPVVMFDYQPGRGQEYPQVPAHRRPGCPGRRRDLARPARPVAQELHNITPSRVGQRIEDRGRILSHINNI